MNKKRIGLIAIILFLVVGLGSFVFANPDSEKELERIDKEEVEKENKNKKDLSDDEVVQDELVNETNNVVGNVIFNTNNNDTNNNFAIDTPNNNYDNSYEKALEAVKKAEKTFLQGDVDTADSLVSVVSDPNLKEELIVRLEEVQKTIDTEKILKKLEEKVEKSESKEDINDSRDYRETSKIVELISKVVNNIKKEELSNRLSVVSKILDDNQSPVIEGILNNSYTNESVSLKISDETNVYKIVTLNGKKINFEDIFSKEGTYKVTVRDEAYNESIITFIVDKTAPKFVNLKNGVYYQDDIKVTVLDDNLDKITAKVYIDNYKVVQIENNSKLTKESIYYLTAVDKAGNTTSIYVAVDKTNPIFKNIQNGHVYNKDILVDVEDLKLKELTVYSYNDKVTKKVENKTLLTEEGKYRLTAVDYAGRKTTIYVEIDKTLPEITGFEDGFYNNKNEIVYVKDATLKTVTINGKEQTHDGKSFTKKLTKEGTYTVVAIDRAENKTEKTVTIDKTAPKFINLLNGHIYNKINVNVEDKNLDKIKLYSYNDKTTKEINNNTEILEDGTYKINAIDKAGNEYGIYVTLDTKTPIVEVIKSNNDKSTNKDVVVTIKANETVSVEGFTKVDDKTYEKTFTQNGKHTVLVKDIAGNSTVVNFEVKRIDKVAPTITVVDPNKYYLEAGEEYVEKGYSAYDIVDKDVTNLVKISYLFQAKGSNEWKTVNTLDTTKLGVYKITYTAYDKAGNSSKGTRVVAITDTTKPVFTNLLNGHIYNKIVINVKDVTLDKITVYSYADKTTKEVENNTELTKEGTYKLTAVDKNGNTESIYVELDTTFPSISITDKSVGDGVYSKLNLKMYDKNGIASVVINGTKLSQIGTYVDINDGDAYTFKDGENVVEVTDKAGNTTTETFNVDKVAPTIIVKDTSVSDSNVYGKLNIQAFDKNEVVKVVINGKELSHHGKYVDINDGDAYTFINGENVVEVTDSLGNTITKTFNIDKINPNLVIDTIQNGIVSVENPQVHATDSNQFTITIKSNGKEVRKEEAKLNNNGIYSVWFGIGYMKDGNYEVEVKDIAGNTSIISFKLNRFNLVYSKVGSNLIDENKNTINNFNSFAIKFNKDVTFKPFSSNQKYSIQMEYSIDGVNYTRSNYIVDNWGGTLVDENGEKFGGILGSYTIKANSLIRWSGTNVGKKWPDIYNAILATKNTDNKVYVRTIFTVVQPEFTKSFTLSEVTYSKGGAVVSPQGI